MNKWNVQQTYWSGFGMMAYNEQTVPKEATDILNSGGMYLTYQPVNGSLNGPMLASASIYHRSTSWTPIMQKTMEIEPLIDRQIKIDGGAIKIRKPESNFAQPLSDPSDNQIRRMVLTVEIEFLAE